MSVVSTVSSYWYCLTCDTSPGRMTAHGYMACSSFTLASFRQKR